MRVEIVSQNEWTQKKGSESEMKQTVTGSRAEGNGPSRLGTETESETGLRVERRVEFCIFFVLFCYLGFPKRAEQRDQVEKGQSFGQKSKVLSQREERCLL